jgi:hypothetical protein
MHTVTFTMTTMYFYETLLWLLLLLLPLLLLLQLLLRLLHLPLQEKDRFKDRHFKGKGTCISQQRKFLCQLCKNRSGRPWWNLRQRVTIMNLKML